MSRGKTQSITACLLLLLLPGTNSHAQELSREMGTSPSVLPRAAENYSGTRRYPVSQAAVSQNPPETVLEKPARYPVAQAGASEPATVSQEREAPPLAMPSQGQSLRLPKRDAVRSDNSASGTLPSILTVFASLTFVVGLFLLVAWVMKRGVPRGSQNLPAEVLEVLGRIPFLPKQDLHLLRLGNRLLLVSASSAGVETLAELTDREEVDRIAGLCIQSTPHSTTNAFRQVFQQFTKEGSDKSLLKRKSAEKAPGLDEIDLREAHA